jgi:aldose 1-epimerase
LTAPRTVELRAGPARVVLAPAVGGAIAAFDWNGEAILRPTRADALATGAVREFACYPLIPFSNRIAAATLHWDGQAYRLPRYLPGEPHAIHGNGWQRAWTVLEHGSARALLELEHDAAGEHAGEWPFPYRARQVFELAAETLTLRLDIMNSGDRTFPFGLGWHPFFPRSPGTELGFTARCVWHTDTTRLPTRCDAVPSAWDFMVPRPVATTTLDNCFCGWQPPAVVRWPTRRLAVELSADAACDHLVVFIPEGGDFIAVEPVTHMTDGFHRAAAGMPDTGTRLLAPGASFSCTMRFSVAKTRS